MKIKDIGWYDVKTKFKHLLRLFFYNNIIQEISSYIIVYYMKLVYYSSRKYYINLEKLIDPIKKKEALIIASWHNSLMIMPLLMYKINQVKDRNELNTLSSKHGDGKIVGNIMDKFHFINITGSSNHSNKKDRGISIANFKKIIRNLQKGYCLAITPDGPRGPKYKINSQLVNIAKISNAKILSCGCYVSKSIQINSWDHFIFPLPFSKIYYYFDKYITIDKNLKEKEIINKNSQIEDRINFCINEAKKSIKN